jgi:spore coat protein U-like protein
MNTMRTRHMLLPLLLAVGLTQSPRAEATTNCAATMSHVVFGASDPFTGWTDVTATLNYNCNTFGLSLAAGAAVRLCFSIGSGSQGTGSISPRRLLSGSSELQFNLYKDAARTQVWGTFPSDHVELTLQYSVPLLGGSGGGSRILYARVLPNQPSVPPGNYLNGFSGSDAQMTYRYTEQLLGSPSPPASCTTGGTSGGSGTFPFDATATVNSACNPSFTVQDIDFGTHGLLTASIDTSATVAPQCTNTTPYQIGLDNGLHAVGNTRRMRSAGVAIQFIRHIATAGRSQRWGNTVNTDTVSATGDGSAQSLPIYARVAPQTTPPEGTYSDTVTVTIYY